MIGRNFQQRGFTLIELMCSMAIGAVILLAAAALLGSSGDGYERVGGGVLGEREARAVIAQLTSDLSTARFHKDGVFEKSTKDWPADRLGFLCLQPALSQSEAGRIGDLCAVNYYVKDLTLNGKVVRCLMRGFRESQDTYQGIETGAVAMLFVERDRIDEPVAFGVVSFEARPMVRGETGGWTEWLENDGDGPQALDVRLVVARRDLAAKLSDKGDWDGLGRASKLLGKPGEAYRNGNLEIFSTMIHFGNEGTR
jgi:prepilin-type N-terminal cleavage/methylation domain-containing protein